MEVRFLSGDSGDEVIYGEDEIPKEYLNVKDEIKSKHVFETALIVNGTYNVMLVLIEDGGKNIDDNWSIFELEKDILGDFVIEKEISNKNYEEVIHYSLDIIKKNVAVKMKAEGVIE